MDFNSSYKRLVFEILTYGDEQDCRNGKQYIIPFASFIIHNMEEDHTLLLRKMYYKGVVGEFNTFIDPTPLVNVSQFKANGCNYWDLWAKPDGSINVDYHNRLHPQLEDLITAINKDHTSRRLHIELWHPESVASGELSLPCCYHGMTFSVIDGYLHLKWTQRSVDVMVGLPSDVMLAFLFMEHVAKSTNLKIGACMFSLSNVHIYKEHESNAQVLLERTTDDFDKPLSFELKQ